MAIFELEKGAGLHGLQLSMWSSHSEAGSGGGGVGEIPCHNEGAHDCCSARNQGPCVSCRVQGHLVHPKANRRLALAQDLMAQNDVLLTFNVSIYSIYSATGTYLIEGEPGPDKTGLALSISCLAFASPRVPHATSQEHSGLWLLPSYSDPPKPISYKFLEIHQKQKHTKIAISC